MKAFIVLCIVAVVAADQQHTSNLTPEQSVKVREYMKQCTDSTHVNPDFVSKARKGNFTQDKALDEFFQCMFKKCDFIDDAGKLKFDVIKKKATVGVSESDVDHILNECNNVQTQPKEKVARAAYECYLSKSKVKLQLLPETA